VDEQPDERITLHFKHQHSSHHDAVDAPDDKFTSATHEGKRLVDDRTGNGDSCDGQDKAFTGDLYECICTLMKWAIWRRMKRVAMVSAR
jgi:hypothetical protein